MILRDTKISKVLPNADEQPCEHIIDDVLQKIY